MKHSVFCVVMLAVLLSTNIFHMVECSYLRFGRSVTKRKLQDRNRIQAETENAKTLNKQRKIRTEVLDNDDYWEKYNNW